MLLIGRGCASKEAVEDQVKQMQKHSVHKDPNTGLQDQMGETSPEPEEATFSGMLGDV